MAAGLSGAEQSAGPGLREESNPGNSSPAVQQNSPGCRPGVRLGSQGGLEPGWCWIDQALEELSRDTSSPVYVQTRPLQPAF